MDISIIIVNWNTKELLLDCLTSVYATTAGLSVETIVVDNGSHDGSGQAVQDRFPQAHLIQNIENSFIVPRVLGQSVGLHPVVMMVMLVVGTEIAGLPGLILAPILTAMLRDVYRYLAYRFADEPARPSEALTQVLEGGTFSMEI